MKKIFLLLSLGMLLSSCSVKTYPLQEMDSNYHLSMTTQEEKALQEKVRIYTSEEAVGRPFEVLSVNRYQPFVPFPMLFMKKKLMKNLYKVSAQAVEKQGGSGAIILSENQFKVIKLK